MCDFKEVINYYDLTLEQQRRFDAHARGEDGEECQWCRQKYFDTTFYAARTAPGIPAHMAVVGAGYVGLTVSACLARLGHRVICVEKDRTLLATIRQGRVSFYEPGLAELIAEGVQAGTLTFAEDLSIAAAASLLFIAVGTPGGSDGAPDLSALDEVAQDLARLPDGDRVIAIKSTVPVGTTDGVAAMLAAGGGSVEVAYNPEFLREGSAVNDFCHPARVIIGAHGQRARRILCSLYESLHCPILVTAPRTAEMIKYASNAFLATKVSFINELAAICEQVGADVATVAAGMGLDPRIGPHYLQAGIGFGGSCLPKDLQALVATAKQHGVSPELLKAVHRVNVVQRERFVEKVDGLVGGLAGARLAVLGLAFKAGTSDTRDSPAAAIVRQLRTRGAIVRAFDPAWGSIPSAAVDLESCADAYEAAANADAVLILTDWPEFAALDWDEMRRRVRRPLVLDGRGMPISDGLTAAGFTHHAVGRPLAAPAPRDSHTQPASPPQEQEARSKVRVT